MKYLLHKADERGYSNHGWLKSYFSFSFAQWFDPTKMGFGKLRVINDDIIAPESGFGMHPHKDMEIVTIPISGELTHTDSMGNISVIKEGDIQRMSAGTGVYHSEFNYHKNKEFQGFQTWVLPEKFGIEPSYEQKTFDKSQRKNNFQLIVSPDGRNGSLSINQKAFYSLIDLDENKSVKYNKYILDNIIYIFLIEGNININDINLEKRDAIGIYDDNIQIKSVNDSKLLIFEVPKL